MNENQVRKSVIIICTAVLLACITATVGLDRFLDIPLVFLLWGIMGFCTTAVGHLVSLLAYLFTGKGHLHLCLPLCSGILLLIIFLLAAHELHSFMGRIGAGIIIGLFTPPVAAMFIFWSAAGIIHALKKNK